MVNKQKASIISEIIVLVVGLYFLLYSVLEIKWQSQWYRSASLFPIGVSSVLIIATLVALYQDIWGKHKDSTKVLKIGNFKRLPIVVGIIAAEIAAWQFLGNFYLSMFVGTSALITMMNVQQTNRKKRVLMSTAISAVFILLVYLIFGVVFQIDL